MTLATYHNHSTWSDGRCSVAELIQWASRLGVGELGISDHFVRHPEGRTYDWSMRVEQLGAYVDEIRTLGAAAPMHVLVGLEVDWFPGHAEAISAAIDELDLDYVVGSVHELEGTILDGSPAVWSAMTQERIDSIFRAYWIEIAHMAGSGLFDIAAHLDLPKKFGAAPATACDREIDAALDAIAGAGLIVEINTAGWHKPCREAYPSADLLQRCHDRGIVTTISADAHRGEDLVRDFDRAAAELARAGYTEIARLGRKAVRTEPIEEWAVQRR